MSPQLIEALSQLGVAAVVFGLAFTVFYRMHKAAMDSAKDREERHSREREDWRKSTESQAERVASAIDKLASSINNRE